MSGIKVGVIGSGIGRYHIIGYQKCKDVSISALADVNEEKGKKTANEFNIPDFYKDYKEMLKRKDIDAVSVCTPNFLHASMTIDILNSGKHVLCEKPIAMNVTEAEKMLKVSKRNKKILMIGFTHRFRNEAQILKKFIEKGELGKIYHTQAFAIRRRGIPGFGGWFTTKSKSGGGPLIDIGVHILDLSLWFMNWPELRTVSAVTYTKFGNKKDYIQVGGWGESAKGRTYDVEDYASAFIRFKDASLILETSWASNIAEDKFYTSLLGDKAGANLDFRSLKIFSETNGTLLDISPKFTENATYECEIAHFVDCIRNNKKPISTAEQAIIVQKIIDSIYLSTKTCKEIKVN